MERRSFLAGMLAAFAAPAYIKAEVLMPVRGLILPVTLQEGSIVTCDMLTRQALEILHKNLNFAQSINTDWVGYFINPARTIKISKPERYLRRLQ